MKKKLITTVLALLCVGVSAGAVLAAPVSCNNVSIYSVGVNTPLDGDVVVNLIPTVTCGTWTAGTKYQFVLSATNTDQTYASLLTAYSLGQKLWVQVSEYANNAELVAMTMHN
ncbi:MAG: hypothetical protein PHZ02_03610 [Desulfocapsaceae bacterium]|nr:hypothetical protein [Desulfocapsaceae bacterium]